MSDPNLHMIVAYPLQRTVGCPCGWVRRDVDPDLMDELFAIHEERQAAK